MGRRKTRALRLGGLTIGGDAPVMVQSMTNTDTRDAAATLAQIARLAARGQTGDLRQGGRRVPGIGIGHALHHHGGVPSDGQPAQAKGAGLTSAHASPCARRGAFCKRILYAISPRKPSPHLEHVLQGSGHGPTSRRIFPPLKFSAAPPIRGKEPF